MSGRVRKLRREVKRLAAAGLPPSERLMYWGTLHDLRSAWQGFNGRARVQSYTMIPGLQDLMGPTTSDRLARARQSPGTQAAFKEFDRIDESRRRWRMTA